MPRYIDSDALLRSIESKRLVFKDTIKVADALRAQGREIRNAIEDAPTADVEEVRHGYWAYDSHREMLCHTTGWYFCSICGQGWERLEGTRPTAYCPHCGAKMDGERREQ